MKEACLPRRKGRCWSTPRPIAGTIITSRPDEALVLGGGRVLKSRPLALVLKPDHRSVAVSSQIGTVVNRRFHTYAGGTKKGVANPKDDQHIDLIVHPRYKDNVERYMQVVRAIAIKESASQQMARLGLLERQLLDPITAATAALRLEAIGKEGIPVLKTGIKSADPEVRFYAAEALAYLDDKEAAEPLAEAARDVPAFRAMRWRRSARWTISSLMKGCVTCSTCQATKLATALSAPCGP